MSEPALINAAALAQPLRIALLGYRSNPFSGGQGIYLKYLSRALVDAGHSVDVISGEPYPELDPRVRLIKLPGLNLYAVPDHVRALRPRHLLSATDFFEWFSMLTGGFPEPYTFGRRLVRLFAELQRRGTHYDVVHDNQCLAWGTLRLQTRGIPLTTTIHHPITSDREIALAHASTRSERLLIRRWYNFLDMQRRVARRLDHIVTVSECSRRDIARAFSIDPGRIEVIHNGVDTETFRPEPGIARNPWQLVTTASADQPLKGTQHLIPAFAALCERYPKLRLTFVGKPKPGGPTERLIEQAGVGARIRFLHGLSPDEFRHLYASSGIAIVPSEYEGFGLPAAEAMACGVPLVSTDGGALPEVVGDAGLIVPARDPDALADAVARLLEADGLRADLSLRGRQRVLEHFSWGRAAEQIVEHYQRVIG